MVPFSFGILNNIWLTHINTIIYLVYQNGTLQSYFGTPFGILKWYPFPLVYQILGVREIYPILNMNSRSFRAELRTALQADNSNTPKSP